ncbi:MULTISPECIES: polysaccharide biosynthesis tyrosine autokinase [Flavobacterium]|uniref:GumC family protein n=1 Tax=Flavobacterium TaxID=237 RepID=UPI00086F3CF4|nr:MULTISPECIES: polysaccharide biosynthesis tyrosine autokinase [Flavobacterium]MBN9285014.1 polysaccharide biosynthesis tyrosine autokinase [Flavobacterium sp.]ODS81383.1 MAG: tyrosine protein kinase [Chryseobacterium sp. SCN 40-13]OJV69876.1 MAG: tyrosine protein kinase [Flavobacterium sp. 40-81]
MNQEFNNFEEQNENNFSIREQIDKYLIHWRWFVLGVILSLVAAFLYLRYYTSPSYKAVSTILVKDDKKGGIASELAAFSDIGMLTGAKSSVDNEVEILKSRTLVENVIQRLDLNVFYIAEGRVKSSFLYKESPIEIVFTNKSKDFYLRNFTYTIENKSNKRFFIYDDKENKLGEYSYGSEVKTKFGTLIVNKKLENLIDAEGKSNSNNPFVVHVKIVSLSKVTENFKSKLIVNPLSKNTSVIELSLTDPVKERAEDFLNALVRIYNEDAIADKNFISENTSRFISQRLELITDELDGVEKNVEGYKKQNKITDITSEAGLFLENASQYEKNVVETETRLKVVASMKEFLKNSKTGDLLPNNITSDANTSTSIDEYNKLVLERNRILKSSTPNNPVVISLDEKIVSLKAGVDESLSRMQSALMIKKTDLDRQEGLLGGRISQIPRQEREFRILQRQQQIKESLYLYLLQKREETAISLAVTAPNAKVVDAANASDIPVSPKKSIIYLGALIIGLLLPFGVIYFIDLLDTKVKTRQDIEERIKAPFLGDIPQSLSANELINATSRSGAAEALRIAKTNLEFMLNHVPDGQAKTIFLTSTFPKEGKTFVTANMAATIALSGKKVLLIGMDIRNPRLDDYIPIPAKGLTNYLSTKDDSIKNYIIKHEGFEEFYVLPSGVIPPNPAELLMSKKVNSLFEELKKEYDYIIVDTAPVSLVTDTMLVAHLADVFIYVVRANYLDKRMLGVPQIIYKEKKLPNMCMLLNDTDTTKGYGYGYGYGADVEDDRPWWRKLLSR